MSAYHQLLACPLVLQIDDVICEQPWTRNDHFRIQFISIRVNKICVTKQVQLSLVRPTKACFGWIPSNCWIFHHSSSFLITLGPSSSAFVSFLSHHWLFNVATSFVNGPLATEFRFSGEVRVWKYEMRCDEEVPRLLISNFGNHHSGISIISYYHHLLIRGFMPETLEVVYLTKIIYNAEPQNCEL